MKAETEEDARRAVALPGVDWKYLRFTRVEDAPDSSSFIPHPSFFAPACAFPGWPKTVRELRVLDPCCGSGHFLVALLQILVAMLREEEKLSAEEAVRVVLGEILHGLEIDARCTQLAAFNVAFAAWRLMGRPVALPPLRIACSGLSVGATREEWLAAVEDKDARFLIGQLYSIWDGQKRGFSVLVNYHRLDHAALTRLIYSYLGDWISDRKRGVEAGKSGSDALHLAAVQLQDQLKRILAGDAPHDTFIRWKPLEKQPVGWHPDLNDGVRLNIRPFIEAGILRKTPKIKWGVDRGKNPPGAPWGEVRDNGRHLRRWRRNEPLPHGAMRRLLANAPSGMNKTTPALPHLSKLPTRITPCPIVEAVMEMRFVSSEPWQVMPGLLYGAVRERYQTKEDLPLAKIPEEIREQDPNLRQQALLRFKAEKLMLQLGPRVLSLIYAGNEYPRWSVMRSEMEWLLPHLKSLGFIQAVGRIGLRYIDFFDGDALPKFQVQFVLRGERVRDREVSFTTTLERDDFRLRLQINNRSILRQTGEAKPGTVLDLDTWISGSNLDLYGEGLSCFDAAHGHQKRLFFELLEPEFLNSLHPEYA